MVVEKKVRINCIFPPKLPATAGTAPNQIKKTEGFKKLMPSPLKNKPEWFNKLSESENVNQIRSKRSLSF